MKKSTLIGLTGVVLILAGAFVAYRHQPQPVNIKFEELKAYFLKNDIPLEENSLNYFIVENQEELDTLFGIAKTMTNEVEQVDFNKEMVVALAYPVTNSEAKITINYVKFINQNLYIDYSFDQGPERDFSIIPVRIIKFERPKNLLDIYFSQDDNIDRKIAYGRRSLGSPLSLEDLKSNYLGTYKGILPCADCSGIEDTLILKPDMTYELNQLYLGKSKIPFRETGNWSISDDLVMITLQGIDSKFFILDNQTLEQADIGGNRIDTELNYKLIKQEN